ncbi:MAG: flagellin [Rhodanobacter sp.]
MTLSINTNVNSLVAQNNLSKSQSALAQATERLSSGLKINSASDNAAGYAISTNFTTQIGGLGQASSNASDAINLAQTTQSALSQVTANLQAIRDLAVQSASGSYTDADRSSIDTEVQQRLAEITRIANQTDFNGQKVLDGSLTNLSFQVGANVGQTISVDVHQGVKTSQIGSIAEVSSGNISAAFTATSSTTGGTTTHGAASSTGSALSTAFGGSGIVLAAGDLTVGGHAVAAATYTTGAQLATAINTAAGAGTATWNTTSNELDFSNSAATPLAITATGGAAAAGLPASVAGATTAGGTTTTVPATISSGSMTINGTAVDTSGVTTLQGLSDAINATNISGVSAAVNAAGNGINFYSSDATKGLDIVDGGTGVVAATAKNVNTSATYVTGTTAAVGGNLASGTVGTVDGANDLISRIDVALNTVSTLNSTLGAVQNRFESTIATLGAQRDNLSASQSTIRDADFAQETANLSKANILQQAGISVLAQANAQPQQVLKLLQ